MLVSYRISGVTLVELLMAIAIMGILSAIAIPSFQNWVVNTRIRTTAEAITNGLQLARSEAVRRNSIVKFTLNADTSWTVGCDTVVDNGVVGVDDVAGDCPGTIQSRSKGEGSANISLTFTPGSNRDVYFTGFGRVDTINHAGLNLTSVGIANSVAGTGVRPLQVTIASGGGVKLCDPNVATGDPKAC